MPASGGALHSPALPQLRLPALGQESRPALAHSRPCHPWAEHVSAPPAHSPANHQPQRAPKVALAEAAAAANLCGDAGARAPPLAGLGRRAVRLLCRARARTGRVGESEHGCGRREALTVCGAMQGQTLWVGAAWWAGWVGG